MKQIFCWEGVKDTKKVHLNWEVIDSKIYRKPHPLLSISVVTLKISRMLTKAWDKIRHYERASEDTCKLLEGLMNLTSVRA